MNVGIMIQIVPLLLFSFSSSFTPGPNNLMMMNSGLNFGIRKSLPHYFGVCLGFAAMILIVALGFGALFIKYTWTQQVLKIVGIAYMLYLAWKIANNSKKNTFKSTTKPMTFLQAVLFQWVNPKAWTMIISAISIFSISTFTPIENAMMMTIVFLIVIFFSGMTWILCGHALQNILKNEKQKQIFNYAMASTLALSVILMFLE